MTLYDIEQEYRETIDALIENGGALTPEIDAAMFISRELFDKKAASYGLLIKEINGDIEQLGALIDNLRVKKQRLEQSRDNLKSRILSAMKLFEIPKFKTPLLSMWIGHTKRLVILHEHLIPDAYRREVIEYKIEGAALKEAIEKGVIETESAYVSNETHLQIR